LLFQSPYKVCFLVGSQIKLAFWESKSVLFLDLLVTKRKIEGEALALDSTFIKARSRRNLENRTGYSDPESRVGRAVKFRDLGCRLHLVVDCRSELPVAMIVASANENEKETLDQPVLESFIPPGSTLPAHNAVHSRSSCQRPQDKRIQKHRILRELTRNSHER
jgi:hypothetical protein